MSIAVISYTRIRSASNEAKNVSKKLDSYADSLNNNLYKKLTSYEGGQTQNIVTAKNSVSKKMTQLRTKAALFDTYSIELSNLIEECKTTDESVRITVKNLTYDFKASNGIGNSEFENYIDFIITSINNKTVAGRWINSTDDKVSSQLESIKDAIEDWYDYDGGEELIKGVTSAALSMAITIAMAVNAIMTGGVFVAIAAAIGAIIKISSGIINISNEAAGYITTKNGDPATGYRRTEINTIQDYLKSSFIYGDDGETYRYNSDLEDLATAFTVTEEICDIIDIFSDVSDLAKNGYKWATGSFENIKDISMLDDVLTGETFDMFKNKLGKEFLDFTKSIRNGGIEYVTKSLSTDLLASLGHNFQKNFLDFSSKGKGKTITNIMKLSKDIIDSDGNTSSWMESLLLQNITLFSTTNEGKPSFTAKYTGTSFTENGTALFNLEVTKHRNFSVNNVTAKDIVKLYSKLTSK